MSRITADSIIGRAADPGQAPVLAEWRADPVIYWKNNLIMAAGFALASLAVLLAIGNPFPWTGPLAAILAVGVRAAYLRSEVLGERWLLTATRLLGPGGRDVDLAQIAQLKPYLGDVLIISRNGDKHLMKYMANAAAVIASIEGQRR